LKIFFFKNLLQLFGLPFITAPGEAEAQCAYLDFTNITEGSITEDSDVWLFGARRVYKNFFSTDQFIDSYSHQVIKSQLGNYIINLYFCFIFKYN